MIWRRLPHRCTETNPDGHMHAGEQCDGLAVWTDGNGEAKCTMHGPTERRIEVR